MQNSTISKKMKGKDLITVGIFSAIYFIINFAFMLIGGLHPIMWMLMPGFIALFTGVPYMLMAAKVQKIGAVFLMGLVTALIYFVTGMFTMVILITFVIGCGLAEFVRAFTKYGSFSGNTLSFIFFSMSMIGSPLPIWLFKESFIKQITEQGISHEYIASLQALTSSGMMIVMIVAPVIGALIGSYLARGLFKKHFERAGIV